MATHAVDVRPTEASHASNTSSMSSAVAPGSASGHSSMNSKEGKLPLPDDYFQPPPLSAKESKYLVSLAKRACKEVVYYSRKDDGPLTWVHLASEDGMELFQGMDERAIQANSPNNPDALIYLRGATKIYASIDEVADFFKLDTPEKLSGFAQTVGKDILDQRTLYTLATPTRANPKHYVAAKWTAIESPSKLARNRDFCYLECHDEFIDTNSKRRGWVRSVHSIRLPCCPRLDRSHGLVRGSLYRSGFIFLESSDPNCVDAIHTLHMDVKGNSPNWIKVLAMKRRIKNIAQVNKYFQLHRLTQGKLLGDLELPAKAGVTRCQACESKFGLFNRKWRCRKCGKVICTPCGTSFLVDYTAGAGPKKVRVCLGCSDAVVFGKLDSDAVTHVKRVNDSDVQPIYDPSPLSTSGDLVGDDESDPNRHLSVEEHDFYLAHEDQRGLSDMMEAKRMQQAFENHLKLSAGPRETKSRDTSSDSDSEPHAASVGSMSGATLPADSPQWDALAFEDHDDEDHNDVSAYDETLDDDDELGLPQSKSEQQRKRLDEMRRQEQQKELRTATQTISYPQQQQHSHRGLGRTSSQRRSSSRDDEQQQLRLRFLNDSLLEHHDVAYPHGSHRHYRGHGELEGEHHHLRKESLEAIRIGSDWGYDQHTLSSSPAMDFVSHHYHPQQQHHHHVGSHPSTTNGSFLSATGPVGSGGHHHHHPARRSDASTEGSRGSSFAREHSAESAASAGHHHHHHHARHGPSSQRTSSFTSSTHERHYAYDDVVGVDDADDMGADHPAHRRLSSEFAAPHRAFRRAESSPLVTGAPRRTGRERRYHSNDSSEYEYEHQSPYFGARRSVETDLDDRGLDLPPRAYRREPPPRYNDIVSSSDDLDAAMSSFHRRSNGGVVASKPLPPGYSPHFGPGPSHRDEIESPMLLERQTSRPDVRDRDELAHYMALSAMKLFEMERGPDLQVPEDVRQTALSKMIAVYADEIERSGAAKERRAHYASTPQLVRRSTSGEMRHHDAHYYRDHHQAERLPSDMVGGARYERAPRLERAESHGYLQHKSSPGALQSHRSARELHRHHHQHHHSDSDLRDLSDLSSSAFHAYQVVHSEGASTTSSHAKRAPESSGERQAPHHQHHPHQQHQHQYHHQSGLRRNDSFMGRPSPQQAAELRESVSSSRHSLQMQQRDSSLTMRSRASGASRDSLSSVNSDAHHRHSLLRPESLYEDAESDTFSELDFVALPHLMRKDYVPPPPPPQPVASVDDPMVSSSTDASGRYAHSFTDVHQWPPTQQQQPPGVSSLPHTAGGPLARDSIYHEGVERRLSELNPDEHIFCGSSEGFASRSSSESTRDSLSSRPSSSARSSLPRLPPQYAAVGTSVTTAPHHGRHQHHRHSRAASSSSSSYSSDEPDYVTEDLSAVQLAPPLPPPHAQMSLAELERYRASLAELMSDYSRSGRGGAVDMGYHRASLAESTASSLSIGSSGFYNPPVATEAQPEREPDEQRRLVTGRKETDEDDDDIRDDVPVERTLHEMYL